MTVYSFQGGSPRSAAGESRMLDMAAVRRQLLHWYRKHKRDLPWRRTQDPYRIWISEIMLQQTRVAAVIPYYERFLALFPDVPRLASAREQDLLAAWAGLGYYSRARNLQKAARVHRQVAAVSGRLCGAARVAGRGRLHGGGGGQYRVREAACGAGWKCSASAEPHDGRAWQYQIEGRAKKAAERSPIPCWIAGARASLIKR